MTTCKVRVLGVCKTRVTEEGETGTDSSLLGGPFYFYWVFLKDLVLRSTYTSTPLGGGGVGIT